MLVNDEVLTSKEVMAYLRISKPTLYRMIRVGDLRAVKIGKNYRFLKKDVERLLRAESESVNTRGE
ncbi:MAG: DNA-binding protein [Acidobacteria bacterium]|nr:MAG: DNA-binding protein [Acidobacteriota bacterium]